MVIREEVRVWVGIGGHEEDLVIKGLGRIFVVLKYFDCGGGGSTNLYM